MSFAGFDVDHLPAISKQVGIQALLAFFFFFFKHGELVYKVRDATQTDSGMLSIIFYV